MELNSIFTESTVTGINLFIAFLLIFSLTNFFNYIFYNQNDYDTSFKKKYIEFSFIKDCTPDQLEAYWLSKKGKLRRKQRRFLARIRRHDNITSNE
jgi:hypothetical protein